MLVWSSKVVQHSETQANDRHLADIFKYIFFYENYYILILI